MARIIMVKQIDERVVFLGRHDSDPMRHVSVWSDVAPNRKQMGETTKPTTNRMGDQHFWKWLTRCRPRAKVSMST